MTEGNGDFYGMVYDDYHYLSLFTIYHYLLLLLLLLGLPQVSNMIISQKSTKSYSSIRI